MNKALGAGEGVGRVRSGRGVELALVGLASAVLAAGLAVVTVDRGQPVGWSPLVLGGGFFALYGLAHLAVRVLAPHADRLILPCGAFLNGLGIVVIYRLDLSNPKPSSHGPLPAGDAPMQLVWTMLALVLFGAVLRGVRDHRALGRYTYTSGVAGLFLLVLPGLLPSSISEVNGAKLWVRLGPLSIQPGEFAKILIIIFAAGFLVAKRELFTNAGKRFLGMDMPRARDLAPLVIAWGLSVGVLALEKELGASLLYFGIVLVMIYIATERVSWLLIGLVFFVGGSVLAYTAFEHVQTRVEVWTDPFAHANGSGFQLVQSLFGIAQGGLVGSGLGRGRPDLVPFANTDFISASIAEELGLVGLMTVLVVYLLLCARGLRIAVSVRDSFGKLLAGGLAFGLGLQVFIVVGGVTQLIPLTGMTMPFLSYGGSSLLANFVLIALLLRLSHAAHRPVPAARAPEGRTPLAEAHTQMVSRPST
jgi:cell division protein FtsW (lipid II flippase)